MGSPLNDCGCPSPPASSADFHRGAPNMGAWTAPLWQLASKVECDDVHVKSAMRNVHNVNAVDGMMVMAVVLMVVLGSNEETE